MSDYVGNRLTARIPCRLRIKIKGNRLKEKQYHTADISSGGVFVISKTSPQLNLSVDIKLFLPRSKKPLEIKGKILRIKWVGDFKKIEGFAVEFKKMTRENEDRYFGFLNKLSQNEI